MAEYIGISGTNGAGKDEIGLILKEHGFFVASATEMLAEGLKEKGWPIDREHKAKLSTEWRKQYGMSAVVDRGLELYEPVKDKYKGFAVGSLRHPGEAQKILDLGGHVIWVDAELEIRYKRVYGRQDENKAAEDKVSIEEFKAQQEREMHHHSGDTATLNIAGVRDLANVHLLNNYATREPLEADVVRELGLAA